MYKPLQLKFLVLFLLILTVSCAPATPQTSTPVSEEELNAAIKEARGSMDTLFQAMLAPKASYDFLGVKVRFYTPDNGADDNWVEPIDYYDGIFTIRMMDGLTYDKNLHADHTLTVPLKRVVDWMIVEKDGTLIGGYTIRLAYKHMSPAEKKEFLRVTKYKLK
jgi:uncharacterized protein YegJ (DUF2314 family)